MKMLSRTDTLQRFVLSPQVPCFSMAGVCIFFLSSRRFGISFVISNFNCLSAFYVIIKRTRARVLNKVNSDREKVASDTDFLSFFFFFFFFQKQITIERGGKNFINKMVSL